MQYSTVKVLTSVDGKKILNIPIRIYIFALIIRRITIFFYSFLADIMVASFMLFFWGKLMKKITLISLLVSFSAVVTYAHAVENSAVQKRMNVMKEIKGAMGVLGGMAKGAIAFDAAAATAAQNTLIEQSGMVAVSFEANETDPKSEALPSIWENWDTFVEMADDLTFAAEGLDPSSLDGIRGGLGNIGASCGACHKKFRM